MVFVMMQRMVEAVEPTHLCRQLDVLNEKMVNVNEQNTISVILKLDYL